MVKADSVTAIICLLIRNVFSVAGLASLVACVAPANAQVIRFNALLGTSIQASLSPSFVAPGLTVTPIVRGSGLTGAVGYNGGFGSAGFTSGFVATSYAQNDYIGFTVTNTSPATQTVSLTAMSLNGAGVNGSMSAAFETSVFGFGGGTEIGILPFQQGGGTTIFNAFTTLIDVHL